MNHTPIEYAFRNDANHFLLTLKRFKQQRKIRYWFVPLKVVCFIGMVLLLGLAVYARAVFPSLALGLLLLALLMPARFDDWLLKRRFRRSPFCDQDVHISLGEEGFIGRDSKGTTSLSWSAFSAIKRFDDGFLAFTGPHSMYWWPDSALKVGTVEAAAELVRRHAVEFHK